MELRSIAFELGLERLQTETTFVKDDALKIHCQQFNEDLEEERFFRQVRPAYVTLFLVYSGDLYPRARNCFSRRC